MPRWTMRLTVLLFVASSGYALGQARIGLHPEGLRVVEQRQPQALASFTGFRERRHPHGLDADDSSRWSPRWGPLWTSGGRHPVWRGCRHVYDPGMTAFLNTPAQARVATASGT